MSGGQFPKVINITGYFRLSQGFKKEGLFLTFSSGAILNLASLIFHHLSMSGGQFPKVINITGTSAILAPTKSCSITLIPWDMLGPLI